MTSRRSARRSLQARPALAYAAGVYAAGVLVVVFVDVPLAGVQSAAPQGSPSPGAVTGTGDGIGLPRLLAGSAVALAVLVPVALALGRLVAGRFLRPLRAITATAEVICAGDLHRRLDLGEPADELTELGRALDDLFARLQASFDAQRHFVANASHELRTPLAGLRALLEVALAVHLAPAVTAGDRRLLESLIANLVDNAIRHNRPGGALRISTRSTGAQATLTVANSGPVVPGDQVRRLFQPFQRLAPDRRGHRDGHGLGLAIVNAVAQAHDAALTADAPPEGGLSITVEFAQGPRRERARGHEAVEGR